MASVQCFLLESTGRYRRSLRRYATGAEATTACRHGYHDASNFLDVTGDAGDRVSGDRWSHDDARWPVKCAFCDYEFKPSDEWQLSHESEYRRSDSGELLTIREAPAGAMWFASWYAEHPSLGSPIHQQERPGQSHLIVKTPGGDWNIDQKSSNGNGWSWTGTPPKVTARPSIGIYGPDGRTFKYHAFLTDGVLVEC